MFFFQVRVLSFLHFQTELEELALAEKRSKIEKFLNNEQPSTSKSSTTG